MKALRSISFILCLLMILPLALTSCGQKDPETAEELIERIEAAMDEAGSYEQELDMDIEVFAAGVKMSMDASGKGIHIETKDDYYRYNRMDMELRVDGSDKPETTCSEELYDGETLYLLEESGGSVKKYSSEVTAADYRAYLEENGDLNDHIYDCETKEFKKNDDGEWEITLSGYSEKALLGIYEKAGLGLLFDARDIKDIKTEMLVGEDFCVLEYELKLKLEEDEDGNKPKVTFSSEFSHYGEAERKKVDTDGYKNTSGILDMKRLEKKLKELITREDAKATLKVDQVISQGGEEIYRSSETDTVKYGVRDGGFFFDMTALINGQTVKMQYENGKQSVSAGGQKQTSETTDLVAKSTLSSILDCTGYAIEEIKSFEKTGEGVYKVTLDKKDSDSYANAFGTGTKLYDADLEATYTLKDGRISSISAEGEIKGEGLYTLDISITLNLE